MDRIDVDEGLSPSRYLAERVERQLRWYGDKSASAKRWHFRLQLVTLVLAASVPVLSLSSGDVRVRIAVAVIGALATIAAGVLALYRFGDLWTDYRSTAEAIKHEKYRFLTRATPYAGADAFPLFVNRVESIILQENRAWRERNLENEAERREREAPVDPPGSPVGDPTGGKTGGTDGGPTSVPPRAPAPPTASPAREGLATRRGEVSRDGR